jgi:cytochrome c-type biogenesis protein CcmH/NrfG
MDIRTGRSPELPSPTPYPTIDERVARLTELQEALALCPTDIATRQELAVLLEQLGQHEEALFNWKAVLACDPNNLKAREGVARCRRRTSRPLQSDM